MHTDTHTHTQRSNHGAKATRSSHLARVFVHATLQGHLYKIYKTGFRSRKF